MKKIDSEQAVDHIYNSLDAAHETHWTDEAGDTWAIESDKDTLSIFVTDEDDNVVSSGTFRLVPVE